MNRSKPVSCVKICSFTFQCFFFSTFFFLDPFGIESMIPPRHLQIKVWRRIRKQICLLSKTKSVHEQGNRKDHKPERPVQTNFHRTPPFSNVTVSYKYYITRTSDYLLIHDSESQPLLNSTLWKLVNTLCSIYYIAKRDKEALNEACWEVNYYEIGEMHTNSFIQRTGKRWQVTKPGTRSQ